MLKKAVILNLNTQLREVKRGKPVNMSALIFAGLCSKKVRFLISGCTGNAL